MHSEGNAGKDKSTVLALSTKLWYNVPRGEGTKMTTTREYREPSARRKAALDPSCYRTLAAFRKAVANGTVDVSKGCRTMGEYHWSLEHGKV